MQQELKIGYFEHWFRPPYAFVDFLREQGASVEKIDYSQKGYLEQYDIAIVEQNGFNDFVENDEPYIQDWVKRGGIMLIMHQDYQRWAPYFLPLELGHTHLVHRYIPTINPCTADKTFTYDETPYMTYMMPWIEKPGKKLFSEPEVITPDEMMAWKLKVNTFRILRPNHMSEEEFARQKHGGADFVRTTAQSCYLADEKWEVIGSYMDPAVRDGALILRGNYGKGMYFLNQILFPEIIDDETERCLTFWKKYVKNLLAYFKRFKNGESEEMPEVAQTLPIKKNYKLAIHMHSLDWYAADSQPGTINAMMRHIGFDICSLALKDNAPYGGKLDAAKYSDDKVLVLNGQEYHPFNWNDKNEHVGHNTYHYLAIGIDPDAYTPKYTCSLFSDEEVETYLKEATEYVHAHGGAICATHPYIDYWRDYDVDAVDVEPMKPLKGTYIEAYWLDGYKKAVMNSVDLYGPRRLWDNPACNFIYLGGEVPCRDSVVKAVREGHTIAACGFDEADIMLGSHIPGDELTLEEAQNSVLTISAKVMRETIKQVRVYSGAELIYSEKDIDLPEINMSIPLKGLPLDKFVRVEIEGLNEHWICNSTPFYLR